MRVLDLFCGAGGCSVGYERAGHSIVLGVDRFHQKRYPYQFRQTDAISFMQAILDSNDLDWFDFIHASPPCKRFTTASALHSVDHPDLVTPIRALLERTGKPYVIENVVGAPLISPILLCGTMFDLDVIRHRLFEISGFTVGSIPACNHRKPVVELGRWPSPSQYHSVVGHFVNVKYARKAMGIDWMVRDELSQAIPPAYTQFIGDFLAK